VAFVIDRVTEEDRKLFDFSKMRTPWGSPIPFVTLTIDRERVAYLARIHMEREPPHDEKFVFWWRLRSAYFTVDMTAETPPEPRGLVAVFKELRMLPELAAQRDTVLAMIKEALSVHRSSAEQVPVWLRLDKNTLL